MATALGNRLRTMRLARGISRSSVARSAGLDPAQLFRIENADNATPTFSTVARLARVLEVSLDELAPTVGDDDYARLQELPGPE